MASKCFYPKNARSLEELATMFDQFIKTAWSPLVEGGITADNLSPYLFNPALGGSPGGGGPGPGGGGGAGFTPIAGSDGSKRVLSIPLLHRDAPGAMRQKMVAGKAVGIEMLIDSSAGDEGRFCLVDWKDTAKRQILSLALSGDDAQVIANEGELNLDGTGVNIMGDPWSGPYLEQDGTTELTGTWDMGTSYGFNGKYGFLRPVLGSGAFVLPEFNDGQPLGLMIESDELEWNDSFSAEHTVASKDRNETIAGAWTFQDTVDVRDGQIVMPRDPFPTPSTEGSLWWDTTGKAYIYGGGPLNRKLFDDEGVGKLDLSAATMLKLPLTGDHEEGAFFYSAGADRLIYFDTGFNERAVWDNGNFAPSDYLTVAAAASGYQPLDADLTAIAALTTTTAGRKYLTMPTPATYDSAPATKSDGTLTQYELHAVGGFGSTIPTTNGSGKLAASFGGSASTLATLDASGRVVELPADAELLALAGLTSAVDKGIQFTGSGTAGTYDLTAFAKTMLDDANAAAVIATLGLGSLYQPLDSDLTAIAALTTTAFGRGFLTETNAASVISTLGLAALYQPLDSDLTAIAALTTTAAGRTVLALAPGAADKIPFFDSSTTSATKDYKAIAQSLGALATPGSNGVLLAQSDGTVVTSAAKAAALTILNQTAATDRLPFFDSNSTSALAIFTAAGRALIDDADASAQRTTLGLAIGTNVQAWDADLDTIAGLAKTAGNTMRADGSNWASVALKRTEMFFGTIAGAVNSSTHSCSFTPTACLVFGWDSTTVGTSSLGMVTSTGQSNTNWSGASAGHVNAIVMGSPGGSKNSWTLSLSSSLTLVKSAGVNGDTWRYMIIAFE